MSLHKSCSNPHVFHLFAYSLIFGEATEKHIFHVLRKQTVEVEEIDALSTKVFVNCPKHYPLIITIRGGVPPNPHLVFGRRKFMQRGAAPICAFFGPKNSFF